MDENSASFAWVKIVPEESNEIGRGGRTRQSLIAQIWVNGFSEAEPTIAADVETVVDSVEEGEPEADADGPKPLIIAQTDFGATL
jgi:hypothetical protein